MSFRQPNLQIVILGYERQHVQEIEDEIVLVPDVALDAMPNETPPDTTPDAQSDSIIDTELNNDQAGSSNELNPDLLSALGESTSDLPEYGENIHENLSQLWMPLLKKGIPKENKEKILKNYLVPGNCKLLQAPKLNAEILAAVPDMVRNRDKTIAASQQQLGLGITAVNRGIDILLKSEDKIQAMKHLSNGCRILCDSHNLVTNNRIKLITPSLDKSIVHISSESERDEMLFGSSLSDKIKAAKAIEKQGLQIKTKKPKSAASQFNARPTYPQGNWAAPSRYPLANRGGRGGYRKQQPTSVRRPYMTLSQPQRAAAPAIERPRAPARNHR